MTGIYCKKTGCPCNKCMLGTLPDVNKCPNRIIVEDDPNDGKFTGLLEEDIS